MRWFRSCDVPSFSAGGENLRWIRHDICRAGCRASSMTSAEVEVYGIQYLRWVIDNVNLYYLGFQAARGSILDKKTTIPMCHSHPMSALRPWLSLLAPTFNYANQVRNHYLSPYSSKRRPLSQTHLNICCWLNLGNLLGAPNTSPLRLPHLTHLLTPFFPSPLVPAITFLFR